MSVYEFGPFTLDAEQLLVYDRGEPVGLGPKVVETLLALLEHPGEVLSKSALLDRIWPEGYVDEANLAQNIYVLRKLLRARWDVEAIETIPRRGYRFVAPVRYAREAAARASAPAATPPPATTREPRRANSLRRAWEAVAAALLALVLVGGTAYALASPHRASRAPLSVAGARLYEIGKYYWNTRSREGTRKSIDYFSRVVDSDPRDARGYAGLALANAIVADYNYGPFPAKVYVNRARAYAHKALAIDPQCGEAYAVLGMLVSTSDSPTPQQIGYEIRQLRHAIELDPSDAPAHEWYGVALISVGDIDGAYDELQKASALDPLSVATTHWLGEAAYLKHRYDEAIAYEHQTLDLSPHMYEALSTLGLAYEARGDVRAAVEAFHLMGEKCAACRPEAAALLADVYARTNRLAQARAELAIAKAHEDDVDTEDLAIAFASVGDRSVALSYFQRMHGDYVKAAVANDPRYAALRDDPLIARLGQKPA